MKVGKSFRISIVFISVLFFLILLLMISLNCEKKYPPTIYDTEKPIISAVSPPDGATYVPTASSIIVSFSENMTDSTINTSSILFDPPISGTLTYIGKNARLEPDSGLLFDTVYNCSVLNSVKDDAGNNMEENYSWSFRTVPPPVVGATYSGKIRIYMVEPVSRYLMYNNEPYHFGFLGFAYDDTTISMEYQDTLLDTITWTGAGITEDNIMAIAVISNNEVHQAFAKPPNANPFNAHFVDACAAADVDSSWNNMATGGFTHTAFIDEGTATWCTNCHYTAYALEFLFEHRDYPFFYAAMITDVNSQAFSRIKTDLNADGYPTCYFDGGYKILYGGYPDTTRYDSLIVAAGEREVPELELSIDLEWMGNNTVKMYLRFINNDTE